MKKSALAFVCMASLLACGDDGGKPHTIPDSKVDAVSCQAVTGSALDYSYRGTYMNAPGIVWTGELGTVDGSPVYYDMEFWSFGTLTGTIDLGSGDQTSYDTCSICVLAYQVDADGNFARAWFQSGGTVNLAADPVATKNLSATFTGLRFQEVSVQDLSPVTPGLCLTYADATVSHDAVPNAWTCDRSHYYSGGSCSCMCGAIDPDCTDATDTAAEVEGCNGTTQNTCWRDTCAIRPTTGDTCEAADTITPPTTGTVTVMGTTAGAKHDYDKDLDSATCTNEVAYGTNYSLKGPDVVYKVLLAPSAKYTFALSGVDAKADLAIALVGPSGTTSADPTICHTGSTTSTITGCVAGADDNGLAGAETFDYTTSASGGGYYYIIVDSYSYNIGGAFSLSVTR